LIRFKTIGIIGLKGFLDLSRILALFELVGARLLVRWLNFCALVDYNVNSLALRQSSNRNSLLINPLAAKPQNNPQIPRNLVKIHESGKNEAQN
jgi:hypothetical protein